MEPLSALSVAAAVVQFIDSTIKVVVGTYKIHTAEKGTETTLQGVTTSLTRVNTRLRKSLSCPTAQYLSSHDQDILSVGKRCDDLGAQLLLTLKQVQGPAAGKCEDAVVAKGKDHPTVFTSLKSALLTVWNQPKIDAICRDLESCRSQMNLLMLASLKDQAAHTATTQDGNFGETKDLCQQILTELERTNNERTDNLYGLGAHLLASDSRCLPSDTPHENRNNARVEMLLLNSLRYEKIDHRYEQIAPAFQKTFEWIFQKPPGSLWADYPSWLRDFNASLYWITGKPGSGKSTLMKFIYDDVWTRQILQESGNSEGKPLLMASVYLWNSGTSMQMSYEGILQSVLYQLLRGEPELMRAVFPHWFEAGVLLGDQILRANKMIWVWEDLNKAFRSVVIEATRTHKVVLFIDGLDEFAGDTTEIIDLVANLGSTDVKLCVSSRPWVAFEDAYGQRPQLRLQDLTQGDIRHYVTTRLTANEGFKLMERVHPKDCSRLIENVCEKSSGVFLWIVLVTKSLLEGLTDGDSIAQLKERLDSLPDDLEKLFWRILKDVNSRNFPRACRMFIYYRSSGYNLTLLDMSFAENEGEGPNFALDSPLETWEAQKKNDRAELMRRRMTACCKGLLEAPIDKANIYKAQIEYLHRTVKDFLEQSHVWAEISASAGADFNPHQGLYDAYLMRLKLWDDMGQESDPKIGSDHDPNLDRLIPSSLWGVFIKTIRYATLAQPEGSELQTRMLNEIDRAMFKVTDALAAGHLTRQASNHGNSYPVRDRFGGHRTLTFLELLLQLGVHGYVSSYLDALGETNADCEASELLHTAVRLYGPTRLGRFKNYFRVYRIDLKFPDRRMIQILFKHGADPNWQSPDGSTAWLKVIEETSNGADAEWMSPDGSTAWSIDIGKTSIRDVSGILKDFLEAGADPRLEALQKPTFTSRLPDDVKALIKRKRRASRLGHYFGSSAKSRRT